MMTKNRVRQILIITIFVIASFKYIKAEEAPDRSQVTVSGYVSDASTGELL
jgi:hypothetical protein